MEQMLLVDDWNLVFRKIPNEINKDSLLIMTESNPYFDMKRYYDLKENMQNMMKDLGEFSYINMLSGNQAIQKAISMSKQYLGVKRIILFAGTYHGITMEEVREKIISYEGISITEMSLDDSEEMLDQYQNEKVLFMVEPLFFFANHGDLGLEKLRVFCKKAKDNQFLILFDEIRSGIFSTGTFLYSQQLAELNPDIICFAKGLALGIATSVFAIKKDLIGEDILAQEDILKSNLSISRIAMERANTLIDYYRENEEACRTAITDTSNKIKEFFYKLKEDSNIEDIYVKGISCIVKFSGNLKKRKLNYIRQGMLAKNVQIRHMEGHLLYFNFAIDSSEEELKTVCEAIQAALLIVKD